MLSLKNVVTCYGSIRALKGVSMEVAQGEIVALIGANGAGKTTTLKTISGLLKPAEGAIKFDDVDITRSNPEDIVKIGISHVPEGRRVFSQMTVIENLELGAYSRSGRGLGRQQIRDDLAQVFSLFPQQGEGKAARRDLERRGAADACHGAGAYVRPKVLLLDEPSMGLAPMIVKDVFRIIRNQPWRHYRAACGAKRPLGAQHCFAAYVLETGKVVLHGESRELLNNDKVREVIWGMIVVALLVHVMHRLGSFLRVDGAEWCTWRTILLFSRMTAPNGSCGVPFWPLADGSPKWCTVYRFGLLSRMTA